MKLELARGPHNESIWYAQSEDFAVAAEGNTPAEAASNLRKAVREFLTDPAK